MTELEQARAYLRACQAKLRYARDVSVFIDGQWYPGNMKANAERAVLAALSWVWDAQQRDEAWQVWEGAQLLVAAMREMIPEPRMLYVRDTPELRKAMKAWQGDWSRGQLTLVRDDRGASSPRRPTRRAAARA